MSWDSYLDNLIAQSNDSSGNAHVDRCAIIALDGGSFWTSSNHAKSLKLTASEAVTIASIFKSENFREFMTNGVWAEGVQYRFLRVEDNKRVFAKKKDFGAITLEKSISAVVIAHCPEGRQQGNANKAVGVIVDYLKSLQV